MAQNAKNASLAVDLIKSVNNELSQSCVDKYKHLALATFANASSERINQFEVSSRLDGIVEKARILNNDPLADALQARLNELSQLSNKYTPEVLFLLLHLSDRPVHTTKVEDLELLRPRSPQAPLTWSDIIAEDPLDQSDDLWKNVDFAADGSDEDDVVEPHLSDTANTSIDTNAIDLGDTEIEIEKFLLPTDGEGLAEIEKPRPWREGRTSAVASQNRKPDDSLTETQAVREVLFMLLGLPTTVFCQGEMGHIGLSHGFSIRHISLFSVTILLEAFASIGIKIHDVRQWTRRKTEIPLEQTFIASLASRLANLDDKISKIESEILAPHMDFAPTLLNLHQQICDDTRSIQLLDDVLERMLANTSSELSFRILECLFDQSCASQILGDHEGYEFLAEVFFECFRTYLKPLRLWMEEGQLDVRDRIMFVSRSTSNVSLDSLWQNQYSLVTSSHGDLYAPRFLHLAAKKIFNTGKSVYFLKQLGHEQSGMGAQDNENLEMTFQNTCRPADLGLLSPFPELFDMAFESWIAGKHRSSSSVLLEQLETQCGLQRSLDALEYIFLLRNGALSGNAANTVFEWIDRASHRWNDSFAMTELFQSTYRTVSCIDRDQLDVRVDRSSSQHFSLRARRSMGVLEAICISYTLPWPVANVIRPESIQIYQRIFVLLLQILRAKHLLQREKLTARLAPDPYPLGLLISDVRHRLLWFVDVILSYITHMVISALTERMRATMRVATDVDDMIAVHDRYIEQLKTQCFFNKEQKPIRQAVLSLLDLTVLFSDIQSSSVKRLNSNDLSVSSMDSKLKERRATSVTVKAPLEADSSDDTDVEAHAESQIADDPSDLERLRHVSDTFSKLHSFVLAAIQGVSKGSSASCYEMFATSLAVGLR